MEISLNGFDNKVVTFKTYTEIQPGCVAMHDNNTVKNTKNDDDFFGICIDKNDYVASVLMNGYVEMNYTGTTPTVGYKNIVASGINTVAVKDTPIASKKRLVTKVDTENKTIGFIL